jgi:hypothetical protein
MSSTENLDFGGKNCLIAEFRKGIVSRGFVTSGRYFINKATGRGVYAIE